MFKLCLILFILVPLVDLVLLVWIARWHWAISIGAIVLSGIVGAIVLRLQGLAVARRLGQQLRQGQVPAAALLDAAFLLVAAALLIAPGFITDLWGLTLLVPFTRRANRLVIIWILKTRFPHLAAPWGAYVAQRRYDPHRSDVIDVEPLERGGGQPDDRRGPAAGGDSPAAGRDHPSAQRDNRRSIPPPG